MQGLRHQCSALNGPHGWPFAHEPARIRSNYQREASIKKAVSGFVEWQPKVKRIEETWLRRLARKFRLSGYVPIETAAVEYLSTLEIKGEIDKEIYCLTKLGSDMSKELALHYDLTIPLARYVTEHFSQLSFPFKRYQIQKVWRGERPQFGRYREFYQADIDVIDSEVLPQFYDAEVLCVGVEAMLQLKIAPFKVGVSNRKIYEGYLGGLGVADPVPVLRTIDKLDKIGVEGVTKYLVDTVKMDAGLVAQCLKLAAVRRLDGRSPLALTQELGVSNELFQQGLTELSELLQNVERMASPRVRAAIDADLSFVRGFDYYTGSIYEGKFTDDSNYGSICSGGRYDNLAEGFGSKKLPGVGFSIGVTRILAKESQKAESMADYPRGLADFCVILDADTPNPAELLRASRGLRRAGHTVNVIAVNKLKKGLQIASRTGAALAMFLFNDKVVVKKMASGEQTELDAGLGLVERAAALLAQG